MESISGLVEHIIYRNEDNGYTVLKLMTGEEDEGELSSEETTCVGTFASISEGEFIEAKGSFTNHPSYGTQFKVESFEVKEPQDLFSMERYLASGAIKGIGKSLAAKIVKRFKMETFYIMEVEPERLAEIKGISVRIANDIGEQARDKKEQRSAMIFLQKFGLSLALALKVYQAYGPQVYGILKENPYRLADDIPGVGFKIADEIAAKAGIRVDSDFRIRSGILYVLLSGLADGHTCLPWEELTRRAEDLLQVERRYIEKHYPDLSIDKKVVIREADGETYVYASPYYYMEVNTAAMLKGLDMSQVLDETLDMPDIEVKERLKSIHRHTGLELDHLQEEAVTEAARNGILMITGGPGTGKTTTINAIIRYFELEGLDIMLAAPTGRAAKRMSETTGYEAKTIHRMLELNGDLDGNAGFERNESNPLETDVIIIDEMSMVDINLMTALLKAVMPGTRLILVGDANQLPSVGPGNVLKDILDSECFPMVRLTKIFRQASQSDIIVNAHKINNGESVVLDNKSKDFFFLKRYDADVIINVMLQLILHKLPNYVQASPADIQVLTPMRKGLLGVERLNAILQQHLNPPDKGKKEKEAGAFLLREGDKVMQNKNNYQIEWEIRNKHGLPIESGMGVFNGDMGIIRNIHEFSETLTIEFEEGKRAEYSFKQLEELELAYAVTIHKSQGSEYPAVVIPILSGPQILMNRNLLYTAVTRAKKCVTLVGSDLVFQGMIQNVNERKRYSGLRQRLEEMEIS